jgi:catechol 2,3-dioxygenase-like lactoylglutathione lyase family enzyme
MDTSAEVRLPCPDLAKALAFFTGELGFRLDAIFPADDPAQAEISGHGVRIHLRREPAPERANHSNWVEGRAGMLYRDLVPGREGGRLIASHIRIPAGGPVADYVHFHEVRFQMIYCRRGWVRVVYEDQGPAFVLEAGDCVLQPPRIRHRVLESSAGLEVIELGSPAQHETRVDHDLTLPNPRIDHERVFADQRFVRHVASEATWQPWRLAGFECRDLGIATATGGLADARVARRRGEVGSPMLESAAALTVWILLAGSLTLRDDAGEDSKLASDDALVLAAERAYSLIECSDDLELLEVVIAKR